MSDSLEFGTAQHTKILAKKFTVRTLAVDLRCFQALEKLPVDLAWSDNNRAWVGIVWNRMDLEANKSIEILIGVLPFVLCCVSLLNLF